MNFKNATTSLGPVSYRLIGEGPRKVLFFHGFPGSSAQVHLFTEAAAQLDLQVLCFDRPGYLNTSPTPNKHSLAATLQISRELTEQLGWLKYEVATVSGGTPYGLSLAATETQSITEVRVICGLGYLRHPDIVRHFPKRSLLGLSLLPKIPGQIIKTVLMLSLQSEKNKTKNRRPPLLEYFLPISDADRRCLSDVKHMRVLNENMKEALRQKARGPQLDAQVYMSGWGRLLEELKVPVGFWHGDEDTVIPHRISEEMARLIPNAQYKLVKKEGHYSLPILHTAQIMREKL